MMQDKKKQGGIGSMIAVKIKPLGKEKMYNRDTKDGSLDDEGLGLNTAAEEILTAFKEGSPQSLAEALSAFIEMYNCSCDKEVDEQDEVLEELEG